MIANYLTKHDACKDLWPAFYLRFWPLWNCSKGQLYKRLYKCSSLFALLGAVHRRRPQSGERGFVQCGQGVLQMRTSILFGAKTSDFSKFMVCPHGQWGGRRRVSQCGYFTNKREVIFRDFVRTSFMDGSLYKI